MGTNLHPAYTKPSPGPAPHPRSSEAMRAKLLLAVHEGQAAFYLS